MSLDEIGFMSAKEVKRKSKLAGATSGVELVSYQARRPTKARKAIDSALDLGGKLLSAAGKYSADYKKRHKNDML